MKNLCSYSVFSEIDYLFSPFGKGVALQNVTCIQQNLTVSLRDFLEELTKADGIKREIWNIGMKKQGSCHQQEHH